MIQYSDAVKDNYGTLAQIRGRIADRGVRGGGGGPAVGDAVRAEIRRPRFVAEGTRQEQGRGG